MTMWEWDSAYQAYCIVNGIKEKGAKFDREYAKETIRNFGQW
jgi:hypothetical protein